MSAETLRRAACLMRERAEAVNYPSPWRIGGGTCGIRSDAGKYVASTYGGLGTEEAAATHIASWHPAVAHYAADLLDLAAEWIEAHPGSNPPWVKRTLTVARAYLGETA